MWTTTPSMSVRKEGKGKQATGKRQDRVARNLFQVKGVFVDLRDPTEKK